MPTKEKTKPSKRRKSPLKNSKVVNNPKVGETIRKEYTAPAQAEGTTMYDDLIRRAVVEKMALDYVQALMKERTDELARLRRNSFIAAHREFLKLVPTIEKNRRVPSKGGDGEDPQNEYWFAELAHVIETIKDAEYQCGFTHDWRTSYENNKILITCFVSHINGHAESDTMEADADTSGSKKGIQANASTMSYLRRYALMGVFGLSARGDDNDGRKAPERVPNFGSDQWKMLQKPTAQQFEEAKLRVTRAEATVEDIDKIYRLTDDQVEQLKIAART